MQQNTIFLLLSRTGNRLAQEILSQHAIDVNFAPINVYWRRMEVRVSSALANVTAQLNGAKHFLNLHFNLQSLTASLQTHPCNENRVFPVKFFSQGKTCFHYRDPCNENRVPCNKNRLFPLRKSSQGKPCFHYRDGFAV